VSDHPVRSNLGAARYRACASRKGGFATSLLMSRHPLLMRRGLIPLEVLTALYEIIFSNSFFS
jgi:hypothetical protein